MACSCIEWIVALLVWRSGRAAGTCLSCHEGNRYSYVASRETRVLALFANPISTLIGGRAQSDHRIKEASRLAGTVLIPLRLSKRKAPTGEFGALGRKASGVRGWGVAFRPVCQLIAGDKVAISANEKSLS
jgi:hypothetical protein